MFPKVVHKIVISFICGDRGSRTQEASIELSLRKITDKINDVILLKSKTIKSYIQARESMYHCLARGVPQTAANWQNTAKMYWMMLTRF
jgi:hypothetical protein